MGIGPVPAIELLLQRSGLSLEAIGRFEINEAQAAQVLAVARALELDKPRLNCRGGSIALGHPLAATGLRLEARTPCRPSVRTSRLSAFPPPTRAVRT